MDTPPRRKVPWRQMHCRVIAPIRLDWARGRSVARIGRFAGFDGGGASFGINEILGSSFLFLGQGRAVGGGIGGGHRLWGRRPLSGSAKGVPHGINELLGSFRHFCLSGYLREACFLSNVRGAPRAARRASLNRETVWGWGRRREGR